MMDRLLCDPIVLWDDRPCACTGCLGAFAIASPLPGAQSNAYSPPGSVSTLAPSGGDRWNNASSVGTPTLVPYSFASRDSQFYGIFGTPNRTGYDPAYSQAFTEAQKDSVRQSVALYEQASGLFFVEVPDVVPATGASTGLFDLYNFGGIRFFLEDIMPAGAGGVTFRRFPGGSNGAGSADVYVQRAPYANDPMAPGTGGFWNLLHEIGHAVGFKHPFAGPGPILPSAEDNTANTVMSYTDGGNTTGLGPLDIAALRYLYGTEADEAARPVRWAHGPNGALITQGDDSANTISGLSIRDIVLAGGGADTISTQGGRDDITGGTGNDTIDGGADFDTAIFGVLRKQATITALGADRRVVSADGTDTLKSIEALRFIDGSISYGAEGEAGQTWRLYDAALGRLPDPTGLGFWIEALQQGRLSLADAADGFVGSAEFAARFPGATNASFITQLYANVLDRAADAGGRQYWLDAMQNGLSRAGALLAFTESAEGVGNSRASIAAGLWAADPKAVDALRCYVGILDRLPDAGGLAAWTALHSAGLSLRDMSAGFVQSFEFQTRFAGLTNGDFVAQLYRTSLDREPDAAGLSGWTLLLDTGGLDRPGVVFSFVDSPEMTSKLQPLVADGITFA